MGTEPLKFVEVIDGSPQVLKIHWSIKLNKRNRKWNTGTSSLSFSSCFTSLTLKHLKMNHVLLFSHQTQPDKRFQADYKLWCFYKIKLSLMFSETNEHIFVKDRNDSPQLSVPICSLKPQMIIGHCWIWSTALVSFSIRKYHTNDLADINDNFRK